MQKVNLDTLFSAYIEELNAQGIYVISDKFCDTYRFVDDPNIVWYRQDLIAGFVRWCHSNNYRLKKIAAAEGITEAASWQLKRVTGGRVFRPDLPDVRFIRNADGFFSINTYNTFKPLDFSPTEPPDLSYWRELIERLFGCYADLFENWIAYKLQHPEAHLFAWLVESVQGTGKSYLFAKVIAPLLGVGQFLSPRSFPKGQFDLAIYDGKLIASFQDVRGERGASQLAYECIKPLITDATIEIEKKYENSRMANLYCVVFIAYNSDRAGGQPPIALPRGDRRFFTPPRCEHKISEAETVAFFERFDDELARCSRGPYGEGVQTAWHDALYDYLINKPISPDFNPWLPPRNERFEEVVLSCRPELVELMDELASYAVLTHEYARSLTRSRDDALIRDAFKEAGFLKYCDGKQVTIQGKRRRNIYYDPARFGGKEPNLCQLEDFLNKALGVGHKIGVVDPEEAESAEPPF